MTKRALQKYAAKRKFTRTPEPAPTSRSRRSGPLLFVVQKHAARRLHYDFRLELDGVLKSWAVPKGPSLDPADKRLAVEVEDHPYEYASFEGLIPEKQYGAGNVIVWDCGVYSPDEDGRYAFDDRREAEERLREEIAKGKLSILLRGEKLKGSFALVRTSTANQWLLIKHKDRYAQPNDVLAQARSVLTERTVEDSPPEDESQIDADSLAPHGPAESMPARLAPMLAEIGDRARSDHKYLYEPKLDGYRALAFVRDGVVRLQSRRGIDLTLPFPELATDLAAQAVGSMIVDGEIVALGSDGRPSFNALQNRAGLKTPKEIAQAQERITGGVHVLRPAPLRRYQPAPEPLCRSAPLSVAMPVARTAPAARACVGRRRGHVRGRARKRVRGHRREAQGQPLSARAPLRGVAEDQGGAKRGVRSRRLHPGSGSATRAGCAAAGLLGRR